MSGYTRQSTADIIPTATLRAAPINAEYNALRDAFAASGGHKHDGSAGEGEYVPLIADLDANNKVQVNTSANTVDFYVEVSGVPVEQISVRDGVIRPITDNDIDLGAVGSEFKDLYIDGVGYIDTLAVHENATVAGTLNVTGVITAPTGVVANLTGNVTGNLTGNVTGDLTGDVTSTGTSTFSDLDAVDLSATGTTVITSGDINSGTIDNSVIGASTPAAGTFTDITADTSLTAATADINGGTLDNVVIGSETAAAATVTDLTATGTSTLSTVDINAGAIDGTAIGASTPDTGAFTTVSTAGQATLASADINGGTIDGTTVGATIPATGAFTTVSASGGVTANVTGNLTGNVTGNVTGDITGDVTGGLTGNVTSPSDGSSTFNDVTIDGTLNMNAGTSATITNLTAPTNDLDAATKKYVDDEISTLVGDAGAGLDTLGELADALNDDDDFSATVTASIAAKLPKAGGTMSGEIAMGSNKITGVTNPTGAQDASTKAYTDTQRDTRVAKAGDTMSGALAMGNNKITGLATPVDSSDSTNKSYVDGLFGSTTAAATSASNAATSETNAATSETNAATSETNAGTSATNAAASYDSFDDRYLGSKSSAPTVDNDGDALIVGALYFNNSSNLMYVYNGSGWQAASSSVNGTSDRQAYTATAGQTVFAATYDTGYVDVYLNGAKLLVGSDFTATNGTSITLTSGAVAGDAVDIVAYGTFVLADHYTKIQSDARFVNVTGDTMTGNLNVTGAITSDGLTVDGDTRLDGGASGSDTYLRFTEWFGAIQNAGFYLHLDGTDDDLYIGRHDTADTNVANDKPVIGIDRGTGDISFYEDTGSQAKFFWDASAESLGIGTSSPNGLVELRKDSAAPYFVLNRDDNKHWGSSVSSSGNLAFQYGTSYSAMSSSTPALTLNSSGNVGIGTSSPTDKLSVWSGSATGAGQISIGRTSTDGGVFVTGGANQFFTSTAQGDVGLRSSATDLWVGTAGSDVLHFATNNSEKMRIDSNGNVGIGTSSPSEELEIASSSPTIRLTDTNDATHGAVSYNVGALFLTADQTVRFNTNDTEAMRIDSSGNLLVGKTSTSFSTVGSGILSSGEGQFVRAGNSPINANRTTSDGSIIGLYKDGASVGSIGANNDYLQVASSNGVLNIGLSTASTYYQMVDSTGSSNPRIQASTDAVADLGTSSNRFADAHFSGTVNANSFVGDGSALTGIEGVPSGIISMWSGAITAIPSGWVICNGLNGTPNLTDRFVIHADADSGGTRNVGASGGSHNTTISSANLPSHSHSVGNIATSTSGNHTHSDGNYSAASAGNHSHGSGNYSTSNTGNHSHGAGNYGTSNVGNHTHSTGKVGSTLYASSNTSTAKGKLATNGNTGGAGSHSHNVTGNSSNTGAHSHNVGGNSSNTGAHTHDITGASGGAGSHSHSMSGNTGSSGSGSSISTIPAFYALAYIMKS